MTREEARSITLKQFLAYMDDDDIIQICFKDEEWDNYVEVRKASKILMPFKNCRIDCIGAEFSNIERPTIRITIDDDLCSE